MEGLKTQVPGSRHVRITRPHPFSLFFFFVPSSYCSLFRNGFVVASTSAYFWKHVLRSLMPSSPCRGIDLCLARAPRQLNMFLEANKTTGQRCILKRTVTILCIIPSPREERNKAILLCSLCPRHDNTVILADVTGHVPSVECSISGARMCQKILAAAASVCADLRCVAQKVTCSTFK